MHVYSVHEIGIGVIVAQVCQEVNFCVSLL